MLHRLILWLSLAGMVLALHLWIQKARGFDQGCLGLSKPELVDTAGCQEVGALPASHLFGVSNAAWGYAFYFGLALLSFGRIVVRQGTARRLHALGEAATAGAFLYSVYLVYQMGFVAHAWCVLCLTSAGLVTVLLALHVAIRRRGGFLPVEDAARGEELGRAAGALFAAVGVLVAVLLFVDRLGTRPLDQGSTAKEVERLVGEVLPDYIDPAKLAEMRTCRFDRDAPVLAPGVFTGPTTPFLGAAGGPEVIVFYDPNCPHCKKYHATFLRVAETYKDRARFTVLPRLLWNQSILQAEALKLAESGGKYFELWQRMFDLQPGPRKSLTLEQIAGLFRELGLDATDLEQRLEAAKPAVLAARAAVKRAGINSVPAVYIDGRNVWTMNRGEDCLGRLIERVRSRAVKPVATDGNQ